MKEPYRLLLGVMCTACLSVLLIVIAWDCYVQLVVLSRHGNAMIDLLMLILIMLVSWLLQRELKL